MVFYKTEEDIELIRDNCLLVCKVLTHVASKIRPGISGIKLDREAEDIIRDHGGIPGFKGYNDFPSTLCISINDCVVHGIPSAKPFQNGDIVSVDCGVFRNGFFGDAAYTFALGEVKEEVMQLLQVTNTSLYRAIDQAIAGKRLGDIGFAVQNYVERQHGYYIVKELVGHGLGKDLHEKPEVANYGKRGKGIKLKEGLVIAIEPMVNMGTRNIYIAEDKWAVMTQDKKPAAHFEHSVVVRKGKADILSDHEPIEEAILKNPNVKEVAVLDYA